jgi:hypothetical protein
VSREETHIPICEEWKNGNDPFLCVCWVYENGQRDARDSAMQRFGQLIQADYYGLTAIDKEAAVMAAIKGDSDEPDVS